MSTATSVGPRPASGPSALALAVALVVFAAPGAAAAPPPVPGEAPWSTSCPGSGGGGPVPQLLGAGPLTPGSDNALHLVGGPASSPATLVFGLTHLAAPFKGGTLCPDPLLLLAVVTDPGGTLSLPFQFGPVPAGVAGYVQVWIASPGSPTGYVSSNGLRLVTQAPAAPAAATLHYVARRARKPGHANEHLMGVEAVLDHHVLVSTNFGLQLLDIDDLTVDGSFVPLDEVAGLDCFTTCTSADGHVYVNLRQGGLAVARLDAPTLTLTLLGQISEPDVFFEKMSLVGDRLYVAAHAHGIRVYSLADPDAPQLVGALTEGFTDAFAIAVQGTDAYVADGDAGLKVVDLSDETAPVITYAEDPMATLGAAEDVRVIGQHVYVAHGSAGVAVHALADPSQRTLYDTPTCAKHLAQAGSWLGVADIGGFEVFAIQPDGSLVHAARERGLFREDTLLPSELSLRLWHGIAGWGTEHFLVADWDTMDLYRVVDLQVDDQPDVLASTQRLRFPPSGGAAIVTVRNAGAGPLLITDIASSAPSVTVDASSAVLAPGAALDLLIVHDGGQPGSAKVLLTSNDPDEGTLPIQVFADTAFLDPTEPAVPFVLPVWSYDHDTKTYVHDTFDLDLVDGQVLFFQAFGTW